MTVLIAVLAVIFSFSLVGTATAASGGNSAGQDKRDNPTAAGSTDTGTSSPGNSARSKSQSDTKSKSGGSDSKSGTTPSDHQTSGTAGTSGTPPEKQPQSNADQNQGGANGQCPGGPYCGTDRDKPSANGNGDGKATGKPCAGCVGKADNKNPKGQNPGPQDHNNGYECDGNQGIAKGNPAHTGCAGTPPAATTCPDGSTMPPNGTCDEDTTTTCPDGSMPNSNGTCEVPVLCPDGTTPNASGTCPNGVTPTCPDGSMPNANGTCTVPPTVPPAVVPPAVVPPVGLPAVPPVVAGEETPGSNRPPTVAGVDAFAPQPPAAVEQFTGPSAAVGPTGVLPSTGADMLMNALAVAGFGLLLAGAATLLLRRKGSQA